VEEAKEGEKWRGEVRGSDGGDAKGRFGFFLRGEWVWVYIWGCLGGRREGEYRFFFGVKDLQHTRRINILYIELVITPIPHPF
jgi:hypothetical protein